MHWTQARERFTGLAKAETATTLRCSSRPSTHHLSDQPRRHHCRPVRHSCPILNGLILPDVESANGVLHVSFPGLPLNGINQLWSLTVDDSDADFKPMSISKIVYADNRLPSGFERSCTFAGYTNIGAYRFPTRMAYRDLTVPTNRLVTPTLVLTGLVTLVSVRTPTQVPDSTFRLDESQAERIWNSDAFKGYGVGLRLGEAGSNIIVKRITADSPAGAQNELHAGDRVLSIAESNAPPVLVHAGKADLPRAQALLQGSKGTAVSLTFVPAGKDDTEARVITLVRGEVKGRFSAGPLLTNGMRAPDIEMVQLTNNTLEHLSDYAGRIVVLEFWAS